MMLKKVKAEILYSLMPPIKIMLTHSEKKAKRAMRRLGMENTNLFSGDAITIYDEESANGDIVFIVLMSRDLERPWVKDASLLCHEAVHVSQAYLRNIGERDPSDELQAYLVQFLTQYLCEEHFEWKRKHCGA